MVYIHGDIYIYIGSKFGLVYPSFETLLEREFLQAD